MSLNLLDDLPESAAQRNHRAKVGAKWMFVALTLFILMACIWTPLLMQWSGHFENLTTTRLMEGFVFVNFGLVAVGPVLCAILLTLPQFSISERASIAILALVILVGAIGLGYGLSYQVLWQGDLNDLFVLPMWVVGLSLPFGAMRVFWGWQICFGSYDRPTSPPRLSIAGIMVSTTIVAMSVSTLGFGKPEHLPIGFVGAVVLAGFACFLVPLVSLVLKAPRHATAWVVLGGVLSSVVFGVITHIAVPHFLAPSPLSTLVGVYAGIAWASFYGSVTVAMIAIRWAEGTLLDHSDY